MTTQEALGHVISLTRGERPCPKCEEAVTVLASAVERNAEERADNKTLMRLAQDLDVAFSAAKIIYDKAWREAQAEHDALKAEVEQNKSLIRDLTRDMNEEHDLREKAEAEVEELRLFQVWANDELSLAKEQYLKLFSELAAARPLLEAAMNYRVADGLCLTLDDYITIEAEALAQAALAYKEAKEKP